MFWIKKGTVALTFCFAPLLAQAQLKPEVTGVPDSALRFDRDSIARAWGEHERLCAKTLKQAIPNIRDEPIDLVIEQNFAGYFTSRWKQTALSLKQSQPASWNFECVTQLRFDGTIVVLSLAMTQRRGIEQRGIELLTNRDIWVRK